MGGKAAHIHPPADAPAIFRPGDKNGQALPYRRGSYRGVAIGQLQGDAKVELMDKEFVTECFLRHFREEKPNEQ